MISNYNRVAYELELQEVTDNIETNTYITDAKEKYTILNYKKECLDDNNVYTDGLYRSIVVEQKTNKILSFSPQKSIPFNIFSEKYPVVNNDIVAEEFIEGTMVNLFYDPKYGVNGCWQIATRNTIGGEKGFYNPNYTFNHMFMDACVATNLNFQTMLNPYHCYSFVLQHPENKIVDPIETPRLYLIATYTIFPKNENVEEGDNNSNNTFIVEEPLTEIYGRYFINTTVEIPFRYYFTQYKDLMDKFASASLTPYNIMGIVVKNKRTGERTKMRNPNYEYVKRVLRGNEAESLARFLRLRKFQKTTDIKFLRQNIIQKTTEYLRYYPEERDAFVLHKVQFASFTKDLYDEYVNCFIKKISCLEDYQPYIREHLSAIHLLYLKDSKSITHAIVKTFLNELRPDLLYNSMTRYCG